VAQAQ
jgi:multidrug efflux pump subunit AcrB